MTRVQIVQEYERAVIFRLGRIRHGGAKSPGLHFTLPCIDKLTAIDLRTQVFDVVPQEVSAADKVAACPGSTVSRCSPRTVSPSPWTRSSTTGSATPRYLSSSIKAITISKLSYYVVSFTL